MASDGDKPETVKNADEAPAGVSGNNVRYVLVASLVAAILLMIAIAALSTH